MTGTWLVSTVPNMGPVSVKVKFWTPRMLTVPTLGAVYGSV